MVSLCCIELGQSLGVVFGSPVSISCRWVITMRCFHAEDVCWVDSADFRYRCQCVLWLATIYFSHASCWSDCQTLLLDVEVHSAAATTNSDWASAPLAHVDHELVCASYISWKSCAQRSGLPSRLNQPCVHTILVRNGNRVCNPAAPRAVQSVPAEWPPTCSSQVAARSRRGTN